MKIGIRDGTLRRPWAEAIALAGELGFDTVELNIGPDYTASALWDTDGRRRLRTLAEKHGCPIRSLCVGAMWKMSPASADAAVRTEAVRIICESAQAAAGVGAHWILVPITPGGADVDQATTVARWIDAIRQAADSAEEAGVVFCLENVGGGCGTSADDLMRLVDGVGSPAVQTYYDIGNAVAFGNDPVAEIERLGPAVAIVHIKDHADLLGLGDVPIGTCLKALRRIHYNGCLVLETKPTDDPSRAATYNLGFMRGQLAALGLE